MYGFSIDHKSELTLHLNRKNMKIDLKSRLFWLIHDGFSHNFHTSNDLWTTEAEHTSWWHRNSLRILGYRIFEAFIIICQSNECLSEYFRKKTKMITFLECITQAIIKQTKLPNFSDLKFGFILERANAMTNRIKLQIPTK